VDGGNACVQMAGSDVPATRADEIPAVDCRARLHCCIAGAERDVEAGVMNGRVGWM
jgi:hypothetical protein